MYAVILLHVDEPIKSSPLGWSWLLEFSKFAVPFFLATAFYFNFQKQYDKLTKPFPIGSRLLRLLIPYCTWTVIYLAYKVTKYGIDRDLDKVGQLFEDPFQLILTGGAAFQLYFIPLLMTGTALVWLMINLTKQKLSPALLGAITVVGLGLYQWLIASGNTFNNSEGIAFEQLLPLSSINSAFITVLLRGILVAVAWLIRCFPYITIAMLLGNHRLHAKLFEFKASSLGLAIVSFLVINGFGIHFLPAAIYEILRGYITLCLGLFLSEKIPDQSWIRSLGNAAFGIYLIHLILVESFYIVIGRVFPTWIDQVSTFSLLLLSVLILLLSWMITTFLDRIPRSSKLLFGA